MKRCITLFVLISAASAALSAGPATADETIYACGSYPNAVFAMADAFGFSEASTGCGTGSPMAIQSNGNASKGADAYWIATAPAGLLIDTAALQSYTAVNLNTAGSPYGGGLFWGPGNSQGIKLFTNSTAQAVPPLNLGGSATFGFQLICETTNCGAAGDLYVNGVVLTASETAGPWVSASGLWSQTGWVRGNWPITVTGDSPSGICSLSASIVGDPQVASGYMTPTQTVWHQCNGTLVSSLNTVYAANGTDTLHIADTDAVGLSNSSDETLRVDNVTPTVSFSGPSTALTSAGPQTVTVNVTTGPSGAYGADCSVNGGTSTFYAGASPQVPVSGVGPQTVTCVGLNNALNTAGQRASSAPASFTVDLQQPTVEAITFSRLADPLTCRTRVVRARVLGRPRTITLDGHRVQVRRYRIVKRRVRRCRAHTVRRRVLVELKRHGRPVRRHGRIVRVKRTERVVVLPHRIHRTLRHVRHGRGTTVSGVLLLADGTPLAGQTVTILGTPNDSAPAYAPVSTATTNADGFWVAKIPAGPSRLLEAEYPGTTTTAAANSTIVRTIVPARLRILSAPRRVAWGGTVMFRGRVYGGEIPRGGINIRLRYGYRHQSTTYGVKTHVGPSGRFTTTFTFGPGDPRDHVRFHFRFATLPGGDYPFHTAQSNTVFVRVGGHPRPRHHRHRGHR